MAGVDFPSQFNVLGRFPLETKYWVNTYADINTGEIYDGMPRWVKDTHKLYYYTNGVWVEVGSGSGLDKYDVSLEIREFVVMGDFNDSNELTTTGIPTGSKAGMSFGYQSYDYEYKPGDNGQLVWTRNRRISSSGSIQVVDTLAGNESDKAPSVRAVSAALAARAIAVVNSTLQIFNTYSEAEAAVSIGTEITLYGYHSIIHVHKSVSIRGGIVGTMDIGYLDTAALTVTIRDTTVLGSLLVCSSTTAGNNYTVVLDGIKTGPNTYFGQYSLNTSTQNQNKVTLRNIDLNNMVAYQGANGGIFYDGCIQFQERPENASSLWNIEDCHLRGANLSTIVGLHHPDTRVTISGRTRLEYGSGRSRVAVTIIGSGMSTTEANFLIDSREFLPFPIVQNQYGTHPAFINQREVDIYLLGGTITPPPQESVTITNVVAS